VAETETVAETVAVAETVSAPDSVTAADDNSSATSRPPGPRAMLRQSSWNPNAVRCCASVVNALVWAGNARVGNIAWS
jgi:hypothetical protein